MSRLHSPETNRNLTRELRDLNAFQAFTASLVQEESETRATELVASALVSLWRGPLSVVALQSGGTGGAWEFYGKMGDAPLDDKIAEVLRAVLTVGDPISNQGPTTILDPNIPVGFLPLNLKALHILPIRTLKEPLGVLLVGTSGAVELTPQEGTLLNTLANHLAMVLEITKLRRAQQNHSLRLEEIVRQRTGELRKKGQQQRALLWINQAVSAHLERDSLFQAITDAVQAVVLFDHIRVILPHPSENDLLLYAFEAKKDKPPWHRDITFPRLETVPGWVLEHKQPFLASNLRDLSPFPASLDAVMREGLQSYCAVPLLAKNRAVGVLVFLSKEKGLYKLAELPFLKEMAAAIAVALDNCLAYEEIKQLKDRFNQENLYLQEEIKTEQNFEEIIGQSAELRKVLRKVEQVAPTDSTVLISGETGTGKELLARAIHHLSTRRDRPLVKINCGAIPAGLVESELFGHERGAFTGAVQRRVGRFELAHGGTIFLDEVGELPLDAQVRILRVLQEQKFERVGSNRTIKVDVRVIAATNRDLKEAIKQGLFRADLFYRLNVFPLDLPAVRERKSDIPQIVAYFLEKFAKKLGKPIPPVSQGTMARLSEYHWPGNIREIENVIERGMILDNGSILQIDESIEGQIDIGTPTPYAKTLQEMERAHILRIVGETNWMIDGKKGAASILGLHPSTLRSRMQKLRISKPRIISPPPSV